MKYQDINDYELVYMVKENDDSALEKIFEKYKPVINKLTLKYFKIYKKIGISKDDIIQEARIGLMNALNTFNENQNLFYSYAYVCMERQLINYCRSYDNKKNYAINYSLNLNNNYKDIVINAESIDKNIISNELFFECMRNLKFEHSIVFELKYNGFTYKEIAELLDLPISTVSGRMTSIRKKLKNSLNLNI